MHYREGCAPRRAVVIAPDHSGSSAGSDQVRRTWPVFAGCRPPSSLAGRVAGSGGGKVGPPGGMRRFGVSDDSPTIGGNRLGLVRKPTRGRKGILETHHRPPRTLRNRRRAQVDHLVGQSGALSQPSPFLVW